MAERGPDEIFTELMVNMMPEQQQLVDGITAAYYELETYAHASGVPHSENEYIWIYDGGTGRHARDRNEKRTGIAWHEGRGIMLIPPKYTQEAPCYVYIHRSLNQPQLNTAFEVKLRLEYLADQLRNDWAWVQVQRLE